MKVLVTGASGHIGNHVVRACIAAGLEPVALVRASSDPRALQDLDIERRVGDLLDADSIRRACSGTEVVFHVGSVHRNFARDPTTLIRPAVEGTTNVLEAAKREGVRRVVVTSSGATVGFAADPTKPLDESAFLERAESMYSRSKIEAEAVAMRYAAAGDAEIVIVNPSGVLGPRDYRITPATAAAVGMLQGDPVFMHICLTDVRDVAAAHVLAAQKGEHGRRYLLTGDQHSPKELSTLLGRVAGITPPTFRPPRFLLNFLAGRMEKKALADGTDAGLTKAVLKDVYGRHLAYDSTRARSELGATFRPAEAVLRDCVRWLVFVSALEPKVEAKVRAALGSAAQPDADWLR